MDVTERVLMSGGEIVPLTFKAFDVLLALVERRGQIISKEELMQRVWPDSFVEESNITQNIYTLRKALGQMPDGQGYIRTVPRRGYYFAASVNELTDEQDGTRLQVAANESAVQESPQEAREAAPDAGIVTARNASASLLESAEVDSRSERQPSRSVSGWLALHRKAAVMLLIALAGFVLAFIKLNGREGLEAGQAGRSHKMTIAALTTSGNVSCAAVSPDGKFVAYATTEKVRLSSLWIEQPATSVRRSIIPPAEARYHALTFSPDGSYIYYVAITKEIPSRTLYRVSVLGGPTETILENVETAISFSPDGSRFAFRRSMSESRKSALFVANVDGNEEREVAAVRFPERLYDPSWSPDGKMIACAAGYSGGAAGMYVVGVGTGD
jgi:DNA-binding winged helix-turn-helix (wHTH) protein